MRKKILNAVQYVFFLGLGIFLLWYSASNLSAENKQHLQQSLRQANYWLVIPAMLILLLSHFSRALRWRMLIKPLGYNPGIVNTFFATMLGYFFNLLVPRLGEVMKCTILAKYEKIPADKLIGTMVAERVCDFICLLIVIAITVFIQFDIISEYASGQFHGMLYDEAGNLRLTKLFVLLGIVLAVIVILWWALTTFREKAFVKKVHSILKGIWQGLTTIRYIENKWAFFLHTVFIWTMYISSARIGLYTMEAVTHLGWKVCFSIITFGSFAMLATQGGIGAYQYTIQKLMPLYGVEEGPGLGFGWILWIAQTGIVIFAGILCLLLLPVLNKRTYEVSTIDKK